MVEFIRGMSVGSAPSALPFFFAAQSVRGTDGSITTRALSGLGKRLSTYAHNGEPGGSPL